MTTKPCHFTRVYHPVDDKDQTDWFDSLAVTSEAVDLVPFVKVRKDLRTNKKYKY